MTGTYRAGEIGPPDHGVRSGILMLVMAACAVVWANSPWADAYRELSALSTTLRVGPIGIEKPLVLFVNDGLMAVFFLLVGVEIKRELAHGSLATARQALLPALAAAGGMLVPALIFVVTMLTASHLDALALRGWAIPCATDIAFSLVVLKLAAPRAPPALVIFLTAVAVIDDLGSIFIIALFYTENLSPAMLLAALAPLTALIVLNRLRVESIGPYFLAGLVLWFCVLKSGVHATLAGVITAFALPVSRTRHDSPADRTEHALEPWVYFGVLPLFALLNAGIALTGESLREMAGPVPVGIGLGLVAGKTLGVTLGTWVGTTLGGARLPQGATWPQIVAVAMVAGIGFTMSIFIASLAYENTAPALFNGAKIGILFGSLVAALAGAITLRTISMDREMP